MELRDYQIDMFQSTRPHGARPVDQVIYPVGEVSIHAPAWGATSVRRHLIADRRVSIHAPAWGATYPMVLDFIAPENVSIHAPAWGAT